MIVRALDIDGDWTFGQGKNNYLSGQLAVAQSIKTRLSSFLGDCFFDTAAGIDWFNLLGSKRVLELRLAIASTILNTDNVASLVELSVNLDQNRLLTTQYTVTTNFADLTGEAATIEDTVNFLLDEGGSILTTEDDSGLTI